MKGDRKAEPKDEMKKLRFCELPSDAPPATKDPKGLITQRDRFYGTKWKREGGITFEEDEFSAAPSKMCPGLLSIGGMSAVSPRTRMSLVRPNTTKIAERARPMTREERLNRATLAGQG